MPYRSAVTGEYVDEEFAKANPDTTVWEDQSEADPTAIEEPDVTTSDTQQDDPERTQEG